jgi:Pup-like protein
MVQQYAPPPERQIPQAPGVLDELERRKREVAAEAEEERRRQAALASARSAVAAQEAELQERIDQLLSESPEDFVIRFLQTEGQ